MRIGRCKLQRGKTNTMKQSTS